MWNDSQAVVVSLDDDDAAAQICDGNNELLSI